MNARACSLLRLLNACSLGPDPAEAVAGSGTPDHGNAAAADQAPWIAEPEGRLELVGEHPEAGAYPKPKTWPPLMPFGPHLDPDDATLTKSEAGDVVLRASVESESAERISGPWRAKMRELGWEQLSCENTDSVQCIYRRQDRLASFTVHAQPWREDYVALHVHLLPPNHEVLASLPGPCVKPPTRERVVSISSSGINQDGESFSGDSQRRVRTHAMFDLDGDGQSEQSVPHESEGECPWDIPRDVYVMRGECGHRVGTIVGDPTMQTETAAFVDGLREIETSAEWADHGDGRIPAHHTLTRKYRFDGRTLKKSAEHERKGKCHHCATSRCSE